MKKSLLSLALLASAGLMASAALPGADLTARQTINAQPDSRFQGLEAIQLPVTDAPAAAAMAAPSSRAALSIDYSMSGDPYTALGAPSVFGTYGYAHEYSAAFATEFKGAQITQIKFYSGIDPNNQTVNNITDYTVFIAKSLTGEKVVSQKCTASRVAGALNTVTLDSPYTIEDGQRFYVGVEFTTTATQNGYGIVIDYLAHNSDAGGWALLPTDQGTFVWDNIASSYGYSCLGVTLEGDLPQNKASLAGLQCEMSAFVNQNFSFQIVGVNNAANSIENFEVVYQVGDQPEVTKQITVEGQNYYGQSFGGIIDDAVANTTGIVPVKARISKINGLDFENSSVTGSATISVVPETWKNTRTMVIEEFTGTWCGYCPRGYVAMEKIREKYTDGSVIPIAVHRSAGSTAVDAMNCSSYTTIVNNYVSGYPYALANRYYELTLLPQITNVESMRQAFASYPSVAEIEGLTADFLDNANVEISVDTKFAFDVDKADTYALTLVVTEDNVGPYMQTNYFAGTDEAMDGWENYPDKVETIFNDVARIAKDITGIAGSLPAEIKANETYNYTATVKISSRTTNYQNCNIIALVLNTETGEIEQGKMLYSNQVKKTAVESIESEAAEVEITAGYGTISVNAAASVYTPAGVCVATLAGEGTVNVPAGLYIVRAGETVRKLIVK